MNNSLIWNIRSVNTQQAFERVVMMNRQKHFNFIALMEVMEPFQHIRDLTCTDSGWEWVQLGITSMGRFGYL